jgi:hypothetical protein
MNGNFEHSFKFGRVGESSVSNYLRHFGWHVIPVYEKEGGDFKGHRFFTAVWSEMVAPDILSVKNGVFRFTEAKHKSVFSWYREGQRWTTGIDRHHWEDYCKIASLTGCDLWLMFLHEESEPDLRDKGPHPYCDGRKCSTGLFGHSINHLKNNVSHYCTSKQHGTSGMIYWAEETLITFCGLRSKNLQGESTAG